MRLLIAEDDRVARRLLEHKLKSWGYEVMSFSNGAEAWRALNSQDAPKLAILNWMMPGMDGIQICREIRRQKRSNYVYIILLTARDRKCDIVEGIEAGADDYVTKPFNPHELKVRIRAGRRILEMYEELLEREKLRAVLEVAGAACHEFNQPLQVISGYCELILRQVPNDSAIYRQVSRIHDAVKQMIKVTKKLQSVTKYETRQYIEGSTIIDITKACEPSLVSPDDFDEIGV